MSASSTGTLATSSLPAYGTFQPYQMSFGSHTYIGDRDIDLQAQLKYLFAVPSTSPLYLHIYCDTLRVPLSPQKSFDLAFPAGLRSIEVFARCFLPSTFQQDLSTASTVNFKSSAATVTLIVYSQVLPFAATFPAPSTPFTILTNLSHALLPATYPTFDSSIFVACADAMGFKLNFDSNGYVSGSVASIQDVEPGQLEISMNDLVQVDSVQRPNFLGHLLETLFDDAAAKVADLTAVDAVRSQFTYISKCCRTAPSFSEFFLQAQQMQNRFQTSDNSALWAPDATFQGLENVLRYRVQVATLLSTQQQSQQIEESIESVKEELQQVQQTILNDQNKLAAEIGQVGAMIVTNLAFSNENFMGKVNDAKGDLDQAKSSMWNLEGGYLQMQNALTVAQRTFQQGVADWQAEQEKKAIISCVVSIFEAAAAIGSVFASEGATAGGAAKAIENAGEGISTAVKAGKQVEITWKKIKELFEKVKKCVAQIREVAEAISKVSEVGEKAEDAMHALTEQVLPKVDVGIDFSQMKLNWEDFQVDMTEQFAELDGTFSAVNGYNDWKTYTQKLILHAYAVISACKNYQDNYVAWARASRDAQRVQEHQDDLKTIAQRLNDQAEIDEQQKRDPSDPYSAENQLLKLNEIITDAGQRSVQRWLFLDFHKYSLAVMYDTAKTSFPVPLSATRALGDLLSDITFILTTLSDKHQALSNLSYPIEFKATEGMAIIPGWRDRLVATGSLPFVLPESDTRFKHHKQMRLLTVEVYIEGLKPNPAASTASTPPSIQINVTIGPQTSVFDGTRWQTFYVQLEPRTFDRYTAADGSMLPDRGSHPKGINQQAVFASDGQGIDVSMFSSGTIEVLNPQDWLWDSVTDVRLEFNCKADQVPGS
ncbi:MAG: hypothetical protein M1828_001002 [Chrysothrix sp. TS-e1954]|nr:MAG: hypothetical protein M1828_001002 [Chrysothrix sp. TS-e1954]